MHKCPECAGKCACEEGDAVLEDCLHDCDLDEDDDDDDDDDLDEDEEK